MLICLCFWYVETLTSGELRHWQFCIVLYWHVIFMLANRSLDEIIAFKTYFSEKSWTNDISGTWVNGNNGIGCKCLRKFDSTVFLVPLEKDGVPFHDTMKSAILNSPENISELKGKRAKRDAIEKKKLAKATKSKSPKPPKPSKKRPRKRSSSSEDGNFCNLCYQLLPRHLTNQNLSVVSFAKNVIQIIMNQPMSSMLMMNSMNSYAHFSCTLHKNRLKNNKHSKYGVVPHFFHIFFKFFGVSQLTRQFFF